MTTANIEGEVERNPIRDRLGVTTPDESISFCNLLVYAPAGVGKTYFCGTALDDEDTYPVLLLDVDGGAMTLRARHEMDVVQVRTIDDVVRVRNDLNDNFKSTGDFYYKTVCIDSLTFLQKMDMMQVMKYAARKSPGRFTELDYEIHLASPKEWGISNERIRMIVSSYKDLPCHLICTSLEREKKDKEGTSLGYEPDLGGGSLRGNIPGYFDIVGRMTADKAPGQEVERRMQTVKTNRVVAKDRSQVLPDSIEAPSIPLIWTLMQQSDKVTPAAKS